MWAYDHAEQMCEVRHKTVRPLVNMMSLSIGIKTTLIERRQVYEYKEVNKQLQPAGRIRKCS